jgi:hypothetical protein
MTNMGQTFTSKLGKESALQVPTAGRLFKLKILIIRRPPMAFCKKLLIKRIYLRIFTAVTRISMAEI